MREFYCFVFSVCQTVVNEQYIYYFPENTMDCIFDLWGHMVAPQLFLARGFDPPSSDLDERYA